MDKLEVFKKIGIAEAISFLLLLGVAMPLKYMMDMPLAVKYTGWAHGLLFVAYIIALYMVADDRSWGFGKILIAFVASLIPFGPLLFHKYFQD